MKIYPSEGLSGHRTPENTCPFKPHLNPSVGRGLLLFPLDSCSWRTVIHYIGGQPSRQNLCRFCTYLRDKVRDNIKRQHNFSTPILLGRLLISLPKVTIAIEIPGLIND
uniref:Uncharacterized protein n=1 Tax=Picea glauca TaxID=3330 RepID=A0A101M0Q4_PICGL|nr:hypothetical protein ABT39_MTgene4125 [Picea glauca]QHR86004.1 hypothetical protein Q903MT_gene2 [Picea sitchensis]